MQKSVNVSVIVRVYEELNDYLPGHLRKKDFPFELNPGATVQKILEILHIPLKKVDLILVNGFSATIEDVLGNEDRISFYPVFESLDISGVSRLRASPLRKPKFIADKHLGRLAQKLRLLGFDVIESSKDLSGIPINMHENKNRILLTDDAAVLSRGAVDRAILIKKKEPKHQVKEVVERLHLNGLLGPPLNQNENQ